MFRFRVAIHVHIFELLSYIHPNMQFTFSVILSALLVSGISCEAEPLTSSSLYKDASYLQSFHHGGHHSVGGSSESGNSGSVGHPVGLNPQIQDQNPGVSQDQVAHASGGQIGQIGQVGGPLVGPIPPYVGQKSDVPLHLGARAIGSPVPYYYGKYASPFYSQYQPGSHHAGYYPPVYPYQYSASPYSASPYSASPYSATPYSSVTPYSASPSPSPAYYNPAAVYSGYQGFGYPGYNSYVPVHYPYSSYYQQPSAELQQSVSKQ